MPEQVLEEFPAEVQAVLSLERKVERSLLNAQKVEPSPSAQILVFLAQTSVTRSADFSPDWLDL